MLVALPELDGAINPTVFAGRHGNSGKQRAMAPCNERINILVKRCEKLILLKKKPAENKKIAIIIFGFPPNAGAAGTAAYLSLIHI